MLQDMDFGPARFSQFLQRFGGLGTGKPFITGDYTEAPESSARVTTGGGDAGGGSGDPRTMRDAGQRVTSGGGGRNSGGGNNRVTSGSGGSGGTSSSSRGNKCRVAGCTYCKPGRSHYCKVCGDADSDHFSSNCPHARAGSGGSGGTNSRESCAHQFGSPVCHTQSDGTYWVTSCSKCGKINSQKV